MRKTLATLAVAAALVAPAAHAQNESASANMVDADGQEAGTVTFNATPSGLLHVIIEMQGLTPGPHGFHVHETGECATEDGFESAGGHYAGDREHGIESENGPHPGDFPNVNVAQNGVLKLEYFTDRLSLGEDGENPLMDEDGSAVVVHSGQDDYTSQPSGDAGERIACGVIN